MLPYALNLWLPTYIMEARKRRWRHRGEETHVILCVADHFEPGVGGASHSLALSRVERWVTQYPKLFRAFQDSDGVPPRHTFFFPQEEYTPDQLDGLAELCRVGFAEVEIHLHHDHDTSESFRRKIEPSATRCVANTGCFHKAGILARWLMLLSMATGRSITRFRTDAGAG